jgi:arabinofuranan 3-O-arabinosyltransferase
VRSPASCVRCSTDGDLARSGEPSPADAARVLAGQGFERPTAAFGPVRRIAPGAGELAAPRRLPAVREYRVATGGMVRVLPRAEPTILDGDGNGVVDLAAFGLLDPNRALRYAADLDTAQIRAAARGGARFVITDSNRRSVLVTSSLFQNAGPVIGAGDPFSPDSAVLDPFPGRGTAAQTVQLVGGGISDVRSLESPGFPQYPEHGPFAALDGDPRTAWLADRHLLAAQRWLQVSFPHPRAVASVALTPFESPRAYVRQVTVNGHRFSVHPGVNRLALNLHGVNTLRVVLTKVTHPPIAAGGGGGITELRIPGVHPVQALRPPTLLSDALQGVSLGRDSLDYVFSRETGDRPFARQPVEPEPELGQVAYPGDGETLLSRRFTVPATRRFRARAWVSAAATASDAALDRIAGYRGRLAFTSSSRFAGRPGFRASSAFAGGAGGAAGAAAGGDGGDGWVGEWTPALGDWLQVRSPRALVVRRLTLVPSTAGVRRPTAVRVSWDGGSSGRLPVGRSGIVQLGRTVRSHVVRITVLAARGGRAGVRAVGIGRVRGIRGLGRVAMAASGPLPAGCDGPALRIGGRLVRLSVSGSITAFDAGRPLRARSCGPPLALRAGPVGLRGLPGPLAVDLLSLRSPAPAAGVSSGVGAGPGGGSGSGGGAVLSPGRISGGSVRGARVRVSGPSWLVLGESYDPGWRASCDGRSLGTPVPLQGYANGWPLTHSCARLSFDFAPDRELVDADLLSGAVCAGLLLLLGFGWWRRRRSRWVGPAASPAPAGGSDQDLGPHRAQMLIIGARTPARPVSRWSARRALAAALIGAGGLGFVFALRAGVVLGPLLGLALWRGLPERWATRLAGGLLVIVVPAIYLLHPVHNLGGFNPNYANAEIDAHFVAVLAVCLLGYALVRVLGDRRAARSRRR